MRRLMMLFLLVLAPELALAQQRTYIPPQIGATPGSPGSFTLTGPLLLPDGTAAAPSLAFSLDSDTGFYRTGANNLVITAGGADRASVSIAGLGATGFGITGVVVPLAGAYTLGPVGTISWRPDASSTADLHIIRDAANTLALRNGTALQQLNLYETYTDASNRSYLAIQATAGAFKLLPQAAGTGTLRPVAIGDGGAKPACDSTSRGGLWYDAGGAGVADTVEVCRKDAADAYAWVSLF